MEVIFLAVQVSWTVLARLFVPAAPTAYVLNHPKLLAEQGWLFIGAGLQNSTIRGSRSDLKVSNCSRASEWSEDSRRAEERSSRTIPRLTKCETRATGDAAAAVLLTSAVRDSNCGFVFELYARHKADQTACLMPNGRRWVEVTPRA